MTGSTTNRTETVNIAELRRLHAAATTAKEPWQMVDAEQAIQHRLRLALPSLLDAYEHQHELHAEIERLSAELEQRDEVSARLAVAYDVIRRLRDDWIPMEDHTETVRWRKRSWNPPKWEDMTEGERAVLNAVAGPDDPTQPAGACEHCGQPVWADGRNGVLYRHGPGQNARVSCCNGQHVATLSAAIAAAVRASGVAASEGDDT